jgi:hypothetical protein
MKATERWFAQQYKRENKFFSLMPSLFSGKLLQYFLFRLKLYNFNIFIRIITYSVLLMIIHGGSSSKQFGVVLLVSACFFIFRSFWWGALEVMRTKIRRERLAKNIIAIEHILYYWVRFSLFISVAILIFGVVFLCVAPFPLWSFKMNIVISMLFSVACSIPMAVYHSGVYALRRVSRTLFSIAGPDLAVFFLFLLLWPYYKLAVLPVLLVFRACFATLLNFYFVRRMYYILEYLPAKAERKMKLQVFHVLDMIISGLAGVFIRSYGFILLLYLFFGPKDNRQILTMLLMIYPIVIAVFSFSRLFYFDQKRLSLPEYKSFFALLSRMNSKYSLYMGVFYWLIALIFVLLFSSRSELYVCLGLLPLFVLMPMIALQQIRLFCSFHYFDVIFSGVLILFGFVVLFMQSHLLLVSFFIANLIFTLVYFLTKHPRFASFNKMTHTAIVYNRYHWLFTLSKRDAPTKVFRFKFAHSSYDHLNTYIINWLNDKVTFNHGMVTKVDDSTFYLYMDASIQYYNKHFLVQATSNSLQVLDEMHIESPLTQIGQFLQDDFFTDMFDRGVTRNCHQARLNIQLLREDFFKQFPVSIMYAPEMILGPKLDGVKDSDALLINSAVRESLMYPGYTSENKFDMSILYLNDTIHTIFIIKNATRSYAIAKRWMRWKKMIASYNCAASVHQLKCSDPATASADETIDSVSVS